MFYFILIVWLLISLIRVFVKHLTKKQKDSIIVGTLKEIH